MNPGKLWRKKIVTIITNQNQSFTKWGEPLLQENSPGTFILFIKISYCSPPPIRSPEFTH